VLLILTPFLLPPLIPEEVMSVTLSLSNTKALSFDYVNMVMLKNAISVLKNPLACIINKSFSAGKVPDKLKIAKILLFPKSGFCDDLNN
jgi:hypothetical protein